MTKMGRPEKAPEDRRTSSMKIPMTAAEKALIESGAAGDDAKPVTWARETLLRIAKRKAK
ncbi:MAG: hypothetical protein ACE5KM_09345 [Planctomycetaceae bacterium]